MILTEFLSPKKNEMWAWARQMGVVHAIVKCAPELTGRAAPDDLDALRRMQRELQDEGWTLHGLE
ncbi:MAG: mannonate dehydratase, partial [Blastochloris sp.]|nr:mannonate dehydratase [Blastochloris sp.]